VRVRSYDRLWITPRQAGGIAAGAQELDWPFIYHRLARAYGWTLAYIDNLGMDRAWEMLECLSDHPLADEILAAVHLKSKRRGSKRKFTPPKTREQAAMEAVSCGNMLGMQAKPLPPHLAEMAKWALDMQSKLTGKPN
jgi:hypothetical protein